MDQNGIFIVAFVVLAVLAGAVMYAMFRVPVLKDFNMSRLYFAAGVLAFLGFIFILSMLFYAFGPAASASADAPGKVIFDACVKVIPPIVTLIIGFYFGTYQRSEHDRRARARRSSR